MMIGERGEVDVCQRIAIDDEEGIAADKRERLAGAARRSENLRRFPGISHAHAEIAAVADVRGDRFRQVVEIEHEIPHVMKRRPPKNTGDQRLTGDRNSRFCPHQRKRPQPGTESSREDKS